MQLIIFGEASQSLYKTIAISPNEREENLLFFLRRHNVPIASSCLGKGLCKKCVINTNELSCKKIVGDLFFNPSELTAKINVSYL